MVNTDIGKRLNVIKIDTLQVSRSAVRTCLDAHANSVIKSSRLELFVELRALSL